MTNLIKEKDNGMTKMYMLDVIIITQKQWENLSYKVQSYWTDPAETVRS